MYCNSQHILLQREQKKFVFVVLGVPCRLGVICQVYTKNTTAQHNKLVCAFLLAHLKIKSFKNSVFNI